MSHYAKIEVQFDQKYEKEMIKALEEVFGEGSVEVHDSPIHLRTWQGEDATKQRDETMRASKCHIVIRKETMMSAGGTLCNDAGYFRKDNGKYEAFVDNAGFPQAKQDKAAQYYSAIVAEKKLKAQGYMVKREVLSNGKIQVTGVSYN